MRYFIACSLLIVMSFCVVIQEVSAARFGGGRSFGVQRSRSSLFSTPSHANKSFAQRPNNTGRWASALGGLLVGGLLASLFMGHGLGAGILTWVMLGMVLFLAVGFIRKRMNPAFQSAGPNRFQQNQFNQFHSNASYGTHQETNYPTGFEPEAFIRATKVTFIRLQAAYDQKNEHDLAEFTAPDVFGEIKMQLNERGDTPNKTEVVNLEAELLNVSKQAIGTLASVRFTGFIKENDAPMSPLDEIWHFRKLDPHTDWVIAGIQQEILDPQ